MFALLDLFFSPQFHLCHAADSYMIGFQVPR
jgi:hypothetical protein